MENKEQYNNHELLTVTEVAQTLRVDVTSVRRWIKIGALEAVTLPHLNKKPSYRVRRDVLDAILQQPPVSQ